MTPLHALYAPIADQLVERGCARGGFIFGLCGPQGSGKSVGAAALRDLLAERGVRAAILALDDLYLTRGQRQALAAEIHPLLATRGPPGTHDVALGLELLDRLSRPEAVAMPRFDKAVDDRAPPETWPVFEGPADVVIFEGWCVGARPEAPAALADPVNALEAVEDPGGVWRGFVNAALAGPYQPLFGRLDALMLLAAPSFEVILAWRIQQEQALRSALGDRAAGQSDAELVVFVQHYERLTRHILAEAPARAQVLARLDAERGATIERLDLPQPKM